MIVVICEKRETIKKIREIDILMKYSVKIIWYKVFWKMSV